MFQAGQKIFGDRAIFRPALGAIDDAADAGTARAESRAITGTGTPVGDRANTVERCVIFVGGIVRDAGQFVIQRVV